MSRIISMQIISDLLTELWKCSAPNTKYPGQRSRLMCLEAFPWSLYNLTQPVNLFVRQFSIFNMYTDRCRFLILIVFIILSMCVSFLIACIFNPIWLPALIYQFLFGHFLISFPVVHLQVIHACATLLVFPCLCYTLPGYFVFVVLSYRILTRFETYTIFVFR